MVESILFAHQDQWIVALTATALPPQPKQRVQTFKREIAVWDVASGNKLKTLTTDAELDELRFGLTSGGPHQILATDFKDHLRAWDLDSGKLKATWRTSSGHPSADGKLLLREGSAPSRLELWKSAAQTKRRVHLPTSRRCVPRALQTIREMSDSKPFSLLTDIVTTTSLSDPLPRRATLHRIALSSTLRDLVSRQKSDPDRSWTVRSVKQ